MSHPTDPPPLPPPHPRKPRVIYVWIPRPGRRGIIAIAAGGLVLALAVLAGWLVFARPPADSMAVAPDRSTTFSVGDQVTGEVPRGAVDGSGRLSVRAAVASSAPEGLRVGTSYEIHLDGARLVRPVRVTLAVPKEAGDAPVWLAHQHADGEWSAEAVTVDTARRRATAEVSSFSLFGIGWLDVDAFKQLLMAPLNFVLYGDPAGARQPDCPNPGQLLPQGVRVDAAGKAVLWCAGIDADQLLLRVADAVPYPMLLRYDDSVEWHGRSGVHADIAWFVEKLSEFSQQRTGGRVRIIRPAETAEFGLDRSGSGTARITAQPDSMALLGQILDTAVDMYASVVIGAAKIGLLALPRGITKATLAAGWNLARCGPKLLAAAARADFPQAFADITTDLVGCVADVVADTVKSVIGFFAGVVGVVLGVPAALLRGAIGSITGLVHTLTGAGDAQLTVRYEQASIARQPLVRSTGGPRHMLLMDVSGSMAENDGHGTVKIEGAKSAVLNTLDAMPSSALVGLRTYPRPGSNCDGGELRSGLTGPGEATLRQQVTSLRADGGTPTAPALRAAADDLIAAGITDGSTIILVSDGESNCGGDPCEVAREIAAQGLAVVHTVGFNISAAGAKELNCVSQATGGRYFDVADSAALQNAIQSTAAPRLSLRLDSPAPGSTVAAGSLVTIDATVTNESAARVDDVRLLLSFPPAAAGAPANVDPGVPGPVRNLGNLAPGERRQVSWRYAVQASDGQRSDFTLAGVAANAAPVRTAGSVRYASALDLGLAGPLLSGAKRVAIVGDSFSAGEGAGSYFPGTDVEGDNGNLCHRSNHTYAMSLAWAVPPTVLACSGALTSNVRGVAGQYNEPAPQARVLADLAARPGSPELVLLTIGGNDAGFVDLIKFCAFTTECQDAAAFPNPELTARCLLDYQTAGAFDVAARYPGQQYRQVRAAVPKLAGCKEFVVSYREFAYARAAGIARDLQKTYRAVDSAVNNPDALKQRQNRVTPIVVLAYPNLLPHIAENRGYCGTSLLEPTELRFGEDFTDRLNATIGEAVGATRAGGVPVYFAADVAEALRPNHTLCDQQPHANRLRLSDYAGGQTPWSTRDKELMHPNADGYLDMTAALVRWSTRPEVAAITLGRHVADRLPPEQVITWQPDTLGLAPVPVTPGPSLPAGIGLKLQGEGFAPGTTVTIDAQSAPRSIGSTIVGADGRFTASVVVPPDLPPGAHAIVATGIDPSGQLRRVSAVVTVYRPQPVARIVLWTVSATLLLTGGGGLLVRLWRRRRAGVRGVAAPPAAASAVLASEGADVP